MKAGLGSNPQIRASCSCNDFLNDFGVKKKKEMETTYQFLHQSVALKKKITQKNKFGSHCRG